MYIHSVKLINFKSLGDYPENEVILEPKVTSIIGRNESGKSNILDGLSRINFTKRNTSAFARENVNRSVGLDIENKYVIVLKPTADEKSKDIVDDTQIEITKENYKVIGGILPYYLSSVYKDFQCLLSKLDGIGSNPFQVMDQELVNYRNYKAIIQRIESIDIYALNNAINFMKSKVNNISADERQELLEMMSDLQGKWDEFLHHFPVLFYRKADKHLKTSYKADEIEKELKSPTSYPTSLLPDLVKLIGISDDEFILAAKTGIISQQGTLRRRINRSIDTKINQEFGKFYRTEEVTLDIEFNGGIISFMVRSGDGEALSLAERSNGLRWYLELFIDAKANDIIGNNVVYLLDEPGTSLHVKAQEELLKLFEHLAEKGNQVVYTTHLPYMLNMENDGIHRIRAAVKEADGYTKIYKTAYDARIAPESQKDTLTPIITAIGMSLNNTFGPALGKINIVTEGMSDYIYLHMMAKVLNIDTDKHTIIPAVGASNCINICSILHGWGCKYIAVFDYDKAGVESGGEYLRKEYHYEQGKQYCYLKKISQEELENQTYKTERYMIEDVITRQEIERFCLLKRISTDTGKVLMAKLMSNAVETGEYVLGEECTNNFKMLFEYIFSCFE